jgi:phosphatidylserine/phosphatidylglycerophosphate/cardiolipin synthase-like enzyme
MSIQSTRWAQGNDAASVAKQLAAFIQAAEKSLHVAIYDFRLSGEEKSLVVGALVGAAQRGVDVKIAFDHTRSTAQASGSKAPPGDDPAPHGTLEFIEGAFPRSSKVQTAPIAGSHLMHSKYIVRDGATVWMGSANFTNDAWTLQENNVVQIDSNVLATHYETDFEQLWESRNIRGTGKNDYGSVDVDGTEIEFGFAPGEHSAVASLFVDAIRSAGATGTVYVASMVLSSGPILGALVDHLEAGGKIVGVYDATQMKGVEGDFQRGQTQSPKLALWQQVKPHLVGKHSTPFKADSAHDFMHDKILATSSVVLTGSFNLSQSAESNAENALAIHDPKLAAAHIAYVEQLVKKYKA